LQNFTRRKDEIMKTTKLVMLVMTIAVALFILIPNLSWAADDGATLYKAKCAMCHGADAAGKPAAKIPSLISDEAKKKSDADVTKAVTETAKHPAPVKGLAAGDVKAIVTYIRSLQK
jgi:mono/diheme cytochrome c family protein